MNYDFRKIEQKWQDFWAKNSTFKAENNSEKPKFYVLDMFPYPSGAGLHVGHPLGYIASDIYARYKRHKGFNVLHPQGYDSFGLPAEQYAIQTGQHPKNTTEINIEGCLDDEGDILKKYVNEDGSIKNEALIDKSKSVNIKDETYRENIIKGYRRQLDQIGFSFDWSREVRTSDPKYYKWTQWIFIQLFNSWYNKDSDKAEDIETLITIFSSDGNRKVNAVCDDDIEPFSAADWNAFSSKEQQEILLKYRLTYLADTEVNWCPALGTVLANDEIVNGVSERGGHPVIRKKMTQWSMRISAYAQRLLDGLDTIDWPQPLKDSQTNWIGRSQGAEVEFRVLTRVDLPLAPSQGGGTHPAGENKSSAPRFFTSDSDNYPVLLKRAKEMRKNPTRAEAILWEALRKRKLDFKFRRQQPIWEYIVDFVCLEKELIVEVDGEIHQHQLDKDAERQLILEQKKGYTVIRFTNDEVLNDINGVIHKIKEKLDSISLVNTESSEASDNVNSPSLGGDEAKALGGLKYGGEVRPSEHAIKVFTTRPDTIFGTSFMTLAPEHELVEKITTPEQKAEIDAYIEATAKRSERDRMADVKTISGAFTGAYAEHPFSKEPIPIWIGDYVLAGYGTGAVMSVPCGDQRDWDFAKHFGIPIPNIFEGVDISEEAFADKGKTIIANSDFLNGLPYKEAVKKAIAELEKLGQGEGKINYRLRDAVFSRQRYWGEPFPVYYVDGMPQMIAAEHLPIKLPEVEKYLPTETGEPPLGNATVWAWDTNKNEIVSNENVILSTSAALSTGSVEGQTTDNGVYPLELNTMPGWAGSSQYFNRYMDPHNENEIFSQEAINYWQDVDLYIGGSEHATGHLLYSRFWQKFMFDKGLVPKDEFAKKLINQGMITGESAFVNSISLEYSIKYSEEVSAAEALRTQKYIESIYQRNLWVSSSFYTQPNKLDEALNDHISSEEKRITKNCIENGFPTIKVFLEIVLTIDYKVHADVSLVNVSRELDLEAFKKWRPELKNDIYVLDNGRFTVSREVEKMSKSKYNVVNPDDIVEEYGADSLRLYEMFLGPLEQSKPWNTSGISGVHGFLKKLWKLYHSGANGEFIVNNSPSLGGGKGEVHPSEPSAENLKTLHKTIKKVEEDIENFSFNTTVSTFMICVNELTAQRCTSRAILEPLAILVSPYAPHIAEELWEKLGQTKSISTAPFPKFEPKYLVESSKEYPISFNGKMKFTMELPLDLSKEDIEVAVMAHEKTQQQLAGREPKKVIVVPGKIVNIVG